MRRRALAVWALGACVDAQCAETCQTCKSASSTDCETCRDGYVLIDGDLDGVGACEPRSVDWDFNAGACRSSLGDHVGMASDLEGCWTLCSELYGANLKAIDLDSNNWCTCQDACECMDPGNGGGYYVMTSMEFADGLPAACEADEAPFVCEATCPDGSAATCCDVDGSCTDGDDDYCCGADYYCSNDGAEYAAAMGGRLCCPCTENCYACDGSGTEDCDDKAGWGAFYGGGCLIGVTMAVLIAEIAWVAGLSFIMFFALKVAGLLRVSSEVEEMGMDASEHGGGALRKRAAQKACSSAAV